MTTPPVTPPTIHLEAVIPVKAPSVEESRVTDLAEAIHQSNQAISGYIDATEMKGSSLLPQTESQQRKIQAQTKKNRIAQRTAELLREHPNANTKLSNKLKSQAIQEINEELIQEELAQQEASLKAKTTDLQRSQSGSSASSEQSAAGFVFGGPATPDKPAVLSRATSDDEEPVPPPQKPSTSELHRQRILRKLPLLHNTATLISSPGKILNIARAHLAPRTDLSPLAPGPLTRGISADYRLPPSVAQILDEKKVAKGEDSPPPAWLVGSNSNSSGSRPSSHQSTPASSHPASPFIAPTAHGAVSMMKKLQLASEPTELPYGFKEFSADEILDIRFTQRTVNGVSIHQGTEHTIKAIKNAIIADFKKGTEKVPAIKIVPLLTFYKKKGHKEKVGKDFIEIEGNLYMKTGVYTSLDNRRLTALKMAIEEMPERDREQFTCCVEVLDPIADADNSYKAFESDPHNLMPYHTNIYMVRDRVNMGANTNSDVHTADCYYDRKDRPVDPYWGFPNLPKILKKEE